MLLDAVIPAHGKGRHAKRAVSTGVDGTLCISGLYFVKAFIRRSVEQKKMPPDIESGGIRLPE